mgnify:CR=1 FL=1
MKEGTSEGLPVEYSKDDASRAQAIARLAEVEEMIRVTEESIRQMQSRAEALSREGEGASDGQSDEVRAEQDRVVRELHGRLAEYIQERQRLELRVVLIDSNVETRKTILEQTPFDPNMPN